MAETHYARRRDAETHYTQIITLKTITPKRLIPKQLRGVSVSVLARKLIPKLVKGACTNRADMFTKEIP